MARNATETRGKDTQIGKTAWVQDIDAAHSTPLLGNGKFVAGGTTTLGRRLVSTQAELAAERARETTALTGTVVVVAFLLELGL